ncbi:uncharacterized protein LOC125215875 isoform X1 [Salvia hispanica]|uniref:uncharacterized protein LOC125215875 isoform X1 n=1 Tax=Salvia hispanica TaxID=49212 RepID=UPI002009C037|nr:uncharacterized protein LOC125215875 isoform X1 [Salvia hispanica]
MEHNQAVDGLLNLFTKANRDLSAVQNKLHKEFQQVYPDHANPMKLVERLKKIEEEMSSLKDECRELLAAKQVLPSQNISCDLVCDVQQSDTNQKGAKKVWCVKEDIALMSSWCTASNDKVCGKQMGFSLWGRVHNLYQEARANNLEELNERNIESMKCRWKRLNANGKKWMAAYKEAYVRKKIGMSLADVEIEAHAIYEVGGSKFQDLVVFNEVMCKHPKWDLTSQDFSQLRPISEGAFEESGGNSKRSRTLVVLNEVMSKHPKEDLTSQEFSQPCPIYEEGAFQESGGSSKRSRTSENGDYPEPSNVETPSIDCSTIPHLKTPTNASESLPTNEVAVEIRALRLIIDSEAEAINKLGNARIDLELKKEQRKAMKMNQILLNTLLAKDHLTPKDEEMKHRLMEIVLRQ